jgi:hypothetical protein
MAGNDINYRSDYLSACRAIGDHEDRLYTVKSPEMLNFANIYRTNEIRIGSRASKSPFGWGVTDRANVAPQTVQLRREKSTLVLGSPKR